MGTNDGSGRYRPRKDWASVSIPSLVNIDEHGDDEEPEVNCPDRSVLESPSLTAIANTANTANNSATKKSPRRSSLVQSLFSGKSEKGQKRRSSISIPFFRRGEGSKVLVRIHHQNPSTMPKQTLSFHPLAFSRNYRRDRRWSRPSPSTVAR